MSAADETFRHDNSHTVGQGVLASGNTNLHMRDMNIYNHCHPFEAQQTLRKKLWFGEMRNRESAISQEHDGTCDWLLGTTQYASWRADPPAEWHHALLWIRGKAGAGKSTMMKFAVRNARRTNELILPHFFNARGTAIERSTEGMYRTLLYWLLGELPREKVKRLDSLYEYHGNVTWQVAELVEVLDAALKESGDRPVTFYIDALDECSTDEVRNMLKVFRRVTRTAWSSKNPLVRVCFASRPYPHITFTDALFLDFSQQSEHLKALRRYINEELCIGETVSARSIRAEVCAKSAGSFMWVVLVINILNIEYDGGRMEKLSARLSEIPAGLNELYSHILVRYPENHKALLMCCQMLLCCKRPLSVRQLWWATRWRAEGFEKLGCKLHEPLGEADMERYIVDISKGLIEFTGGGKLRRAQFLHESVREFILNSDELRRLSGVKDRKTFHAVSHEAVRDCCLAALESGRPGLQELIQRYGAFDIPLRAIRDIWPSHVESEHPLAIYAAEKIILHAEVAHRWGSDQSAFLHDFTKRCGPYFLSPREIMGLDRVTVLHSVISLLLEADCATLVSDTQRQPARRAWEQGHPFGLIDGPHVPICRSFKYGSLKPVSALMEIHLQLRPRHPELQAVIHLLAESWLNEYSFVHYSPTKAPLLDIAGYCPHLASFLLLSFVPDGALNLHLDSLKDIFHMKSPHTRTQAPPAAFSRFVEALYLLIDKEVCSDAITFGDSDLLDWISLADRDILDTEGSGAPILGLLDKVRTLVKGRQRPLPSRLLQSRSVHDEGGSSSTVDKE